MADLILGAVSASYNNGISEDSAKRKLIIYIEDLLQHEIWATTLNERKFNVFQINLKNW